MEKLQEEAFNKQEEDKHSYVIEHAKPICEQLEPNGENLTELDCEPVEVFKTTVEIPGFRHSVGVTDLEPGKTYRFSIRACVKNLANGCGPEKVLLASTISKELASLLAHISPQYD